MPVLKTTSPMAVPMAPKPRPRSTVPSASTSRAAGLVTVGSLTKDVKALVHTAREAGVATHILPAVDAVNEEQKRALFEKIRTYYRGQLAGKTFALWGLAFKPETDDVREAPALVMAEALLAEGQG